MTVKATIYLVRHGETDANRNRIIQGQMDVPLNQVGLEQAKAVGVALQSVMFDVAFTSDLSRATATATAILRYQRPIELRRQQELRERFMGELQGQVVDWLTKFASSRESTVEGKTEFSKRTVEWWNKELHGYLTSLQPREQPSNILVVSHGGFIGTLVRNLIRSNQVRPEKDVVVFTCPNTSVSIIELNGDRGRLLCYADASHLAAGALEQNADEVPT